MKVLFLTRATLYKVYGGDTVQIESTAKYLRRIGVEVDIKLTGNAIDYTPYDLIHFFNITRPADLLPHIRRSGKPYLVSTIFVDYSDYEAFSKRGITALPRRILGADRLEYLKAVARWVRNGERIQSMEYLLAGHRAAVCRVARGAAALLPNSESEYRRFVAKYPAANRYHIIPNAIDPESFSFTDEGLDAIRDRREVLCVARIEGKKNQLNLIRALNGTEFRLTLVGKPAPNHLKYYEACRREAAGNVSFADFVPWDQVVLSYLKAGVHVLPSWNETCGLSTMEAAYAGCNVVITDKGDTRDYFGNHAVYCDPGDPESIYEAVRESAARPADTGLREKILHTYTWDEAARQTVKAYESALVPAPQPVFPTAPQPA